VKSSTCNGAKDRAAAITTSNLRPGVVVPHPLLAPRRQLHRHGWHCPCPHPRRVRKHPLGRLQAKDTACDVCQCGLLAAVEDFSAILANVREVLHREFGLQKSFITKGMGIDSGMTMLACGMYQPWKAWATPINKDAARISFVPVMSIPPLCLTTPYMMSSKPKRCYRF
jgi:hypothetical protein